MALCWRSFISAKSQKPTAKVKKNERKSWFDSDERSFCVFSKDNGRTKYKRIGIIKPIKGKIWDNRYMAVEEEADNALLKYITFKVVSGNGFYPGMLVREIR